MPGAFTGTASSTTSQMEKILRAFSPLYEKQMIPANFQMPPHSHPYSEVVTVISGTIGSTHHEKFEKKGEMLKPGSWVYRAKHAHYARTRKRGGDPPSSVHRSGRHRFHQPR
jgi:hypothetical protein